jgi:Uma2 family endonuclease
MAASTLVPLSEYLKTSYRPDRDWIDGEAKERNMGELPHASVQVFFSAYFTIHKQEFSTRVYSELRLQVSPQRFRIPDVLLMRKTDPAETIVTIAPLLCIEILSRDDSMSDIQERIDDYLAMGVCTIWVVDPRRRKAYQTDGQSLQPVETLSVPETPISIPLAEVFAELDELEARPQP